MALTLVTRPFWARMHRCLGLATAVFLALAGLTGALLAFYHELDSALNASVQHVEVRALPGLQAGELIERVERQLPGARVSFLALDAVPGQAVRLRMAPWPAGAGKVQPLGFDEVFADPYTGRVLGKRLWGAVAFDATHLMPFVFKLHRTLQLPDKWGVWLLGIVSLLWMLDCLIGLYLTLPKGRPFWGKWMTAWRIKRAAGAYRITLDLHRAGGLWLWTVLFAIAMSGVYFNLNQQVFRPVVGLFGALTANPNDSLAKRKSPQAAPAIPVDAAIELARQQLPASASGMEPGFVAYLPERGVYRVGFQEAGRGRDAFKLRYEQVYLDGDTGVLKARHGYDSGTAADAFLSWQYPLHSGQILGLPGRILVCVAGLATAMLSVTGIAIWVRKRRAQTPARRRNATANQATPRPAEAGE